MFLDNSVTEPGPCTALVADVVRRRSALPAPHCVLPAVLPAKSAEVEADPCPDPRVTEPLPWQTRRPRF